MSYISKRVIILQYRIDINKQYNEAILLITYTNQAKYAFQKYLINTHKISKKNLRRPRQERRDQPHRELDKWKKRYFMVKVHIYKWFVII